MTALNAFLTTWSNARSTFGGGSPQTGAQYDNSGTLRQLESGLEAAAPGSRWTGSAATAYGTANTEHRRVIGEMAGLDQRLSAHVDQSAEVVAAGRRDLDSVRSWVVAAASSVPPGAAGEKMMLPIAQKGIGQVIDIVQRSNGDLNSIGESIRALGGEYQLLGNQKFGIKEGPWFEPDEPGDKHDKSKSEQEVLDDILRRYQVSDDEMVTREYPWPINQFKDPQELTASEARMIDNLSIAEKIDFYEIRMEAEAEAERRFPEGPNVGSHRDAFRHTYWNALMTERFGEEWTNEYATAHERKPVNTAADEAMDLHNNEVGRTIAAANPDASSAHLADMAEQAVRNGDTVVIRPDGLGLQWSDNIPVGGPTGPTDRGPHGGANDQGPLPNPPTPGGDYDPGPAGEYGNVPRGF